MKANLFDIVLICLGLSTQVVFMLKREWLFEQKTMSSFLIGCVLLFATSLLLLLFGAGNPKYVSFLTMPLMSLLIFIGLKNWYLLKFKEQPKDTFWSNDLSRIGDAGFNVIFWLSGLFIPIAVIVFFLKITGIVPI
jgi:hypothetical protein